MVTRRWSWGTGIRPLQSEKRHPFPCCGRPYDHQMTLYKSHWIIFTPKRKLTNKHFRNNKKHHPCPILLCIIITNHITNHNYFLRPACFLLLHSRSPFLFLCIITWRSLALPGCRRLFLRGKMCRLSADTDSRNKREKTSGTHGFTCWSALNTGQNKINILRTRLKLLRMAYVL